MIDSYSISKYARLKKRGWVYSTRMACRTVWLSMSWALVKLSEAWCGNDEFVFCGQTYPYCTAFYNQTWRNQRKVEIPIFKQILDEATGRVLEVGRVMPYYMPTSHTVVDKYDPRSTVVSDIMDYHEGGYDLIISVCTLEHIGVDEPEQDLDKALRAYEHIKSLLAPGGKFLWTIPLGSHRRLETFLAPDAVRYMVLEQGAWIEYDQPKSTTIMFGGTSRETN